MAGATGYQIFYGTTPSADEYADTFDYSGNAWILNRKIGGLNPGTKYYFKVRAVNDCAGGMFSQVVSATTTGGNSYKMVIDKTPATVDEIIEKAAEKVSEIPVINDVVDKKIVVEKVEVKSKPTIISYVVKAGDSLWSITKEIFGKGRDITNFVAQILEKNPGLPSGSNVQVGSELKIDVGSLSYEEIESMFPEESPKTNGYDLDVKVLANAGTPMKGVSVTLHSTPMTSVTNDEGIAHFSGVEEGKHTIYLAYGNYSGGGQSVSLTGNNKNIEVTMQISLTSGFNSPKVIGVIIIMGSIICILSFVILKQKKLSKSVVNS